MGKRERAGLGGARVHGHKLRGGRPICAAREALMGRGECPVGGPGTAVCQAWAWKPAPCPLLKLYPL